MNFLVLFVNVQLSVFDQILDLYLSNMDINFSIWTLCIQIRIV